MDAQLLQEEIKTEMQQVQLGPKPNSIRYYNRLCTRNNFTIGDLAYSREMMKHYKQKYDQAKRYYDYMFGQFQDVMEQGDSEVDEDYITATYGDVWKNDL